MCVPSSMRCWKRGLIAKLKVNKQLNDKERVAAALENPALLEVLEQCLSTAGHPQVN